MSPIERFRAALRRRRGDQVLIGTSRALPSRLPMLALPAPPRSGEDTYPLHRRSPVPEYPPCPHCGERHPPLPTLPVSWSASLLPRPGRPAPLGRQPGHREALTRDGFRPWQAG